MPDTSKIRESLLFNYETTSKYDYRGGEIRPLVKTTYRAREKRPQPPFVPLKDLHAMTPWKNSSLPFDLYHRPKEIIRTDPRSAQKPYGRLPDLNRAEVQKTRPKVVMIPAYDLDRVEEPIRQQVVDHIYVSTMNMDLKDAVEKANIKNVCAPLPGAYTPSNSVPLEPLLMPYISPEWRMECVPWDNRQLRSHTEPTKRFWLSRSPPYCSVCESSALGDVRKKRRCQ